MNSKYAKMNNSELEESEKCLSFLHQKQSLYVEDVKMNLGFALSDLNKFLNRDYIELSNEQLGAEVRTISARKRYLEEALNIELKKLSNILEELERSRESMKLRSLTY